jgi:glutamyl-tRNA synthetase
VEFDDKMRGHVRGVADDVVVRRNDGVPSYNIAVVVDDALQGVTEVVRGDDLVDITPTHIWLQRLLKLPTPKYAHVPLVVGPDGERLAKRHGAVTLPEVMRHGVSVEQVHEYLCASLGCTGPSDFEWSQVPAEQWVFSDDIRGNIE